MLNQPSVLITGASRGLGRAMALAFAKKGYAVGINYLSNLTEAQGIEKEITRLGVPCRLLQANVASSSEVAAMMKTLSEVWGRLDVLVNNAGATKNSLISKMSDEDWRSVLAVNLDGVFYCTRAALALMRERREGAIVNVGSFLVGHESRGAANYAASKAGVLSLTRSAAVEEGAFNIRVNAVLPGFHVTDMNRKVWERFEEKIRSQHILKDLPDRAGLADFVVSVAEMKTVTGQLFPYESRLV